MGTALAILAALAFALGTVLQQKGTLGTTDRAGDSHWLVQILHEPVWLSGMVLQSSGWILQAAALDRAPLIVVQSITTLSIGRSAPRPPDAPGWGARPLPASWIEMREGPP